MRMQIVKTSDLIFPHPTTPSPPSWTLGWLLWVQDHVIMMAQLLCSAYCQKQALPVTAWRYFWYSCLEEVTLEYCYCESILCPLATYFPQNRNAFLENLLFEIQSPWRPVPLLSTLSKRRSLTCIRTSYQTQRLHSKTPHCPSRLFLFTSSCK